MRKILFLIIVATALVAGACSAGNDTPVTTVAALGGTWKLTHVGGSVAGIDQDFTPGAATWTFNVESNTVNVVNNNPDDSLTDFFPPGIIPMVTCKTRFHPNLARIRSLCRISISAVLLLPLLP